ncbi:SIMPL domain-containing protein [Microbacterium schleiferi]|uniref:SIMPL domain-containing protein n=1 Tax=Microbacterium schleiferi TaxID=69362 RepID=A0A7S8RGK8_9MICO|nr:SIMPL domain-containing protein [Microbacterium schleiferi]QPE03652.1 SIMPL domain-containing protein [Microbacterium schleiferi]
MRDVIITVRGEHQTRVAPEEAVARLTIRTEGEERTSVMTQATDAASILRTALTARQDAGEVREWSTGRVSVRSERPWNNEGKQLPLVHHASLDVSATFADLDALSGWLGEVSELDAIHVDGVRWMLTEATRAAVEADVSANAVRVAMTRATAYAAALGLAEVTAVEVADVGLLGGGAPVAASGPAPRMMMAASPMDAGVSLELQPADIVVTAAVEARFSAR